MEATVIPASPPFQKYPYDGIGGALSLAYKGEEVFMSLEPFTLTRGEQQRDFREGDFFCKGSVDVPGSFQGEIKDINTLKVIPPRIGLYVGEGTSYFMYYPFLAFLERFGFDYTLLHDKSFSQGNLSQCNVVIIPGGGTYWDNLKGLFGGDKGHKALIEFVEQGGGYIGTCFGSYVAMGSSPAYLQGSFNITPSTNRFGREWQHTGVGYVYMRLQNHPISAGVSRRLEVLHWNGVVWDTESPGVIAEYEEWGMENDLWNSNPLTEEAFNRNMKGFPAIIADTFGKGIIILSGPHPEFGLHYKRHLSVLKYFGKEDSRDVMTRVETPFFEDPTWRCLFNMVVYAARKEVGPLPSFEIADSEYVLRCSRLVHLMDRIDLDCRLFKGDEKIEYEKNLIYEYSQRIPRILYSLCRRKEILPKTAFIAEKSLPFLQYAYAVQPDEEDSALPEEGFVAAARESHTAQNLAHIALAFEGILYPLEAIQMYSQRNSEV